jgi:hypothetical protein
MNARFGQTAFSVGGRDYVWEDVVIAAHLWGDWHDDLGSTELDRLARKLAGRAAVFDRLSEEAERSTDLPEAELSAVVESLPRRLRESGLAGISPESFRQRIAFLARLEVAFRRFADAGATRAAVDREIVARVDWPAVRSASRSASEVDS